MGILFLQIHVIIKYYNIFKKFAILICISVTVHDFVPFLYVCLAVRMFFSRLKSYFLLIFLLLACSSQFLNALLCMTDIFYSYLFYLLTLFIFLHFRLLNFYMDRSLFFICFHSGLRKISLTLDCTCSLLDILGRFTFF